MLKINDNVFLMFSIFYFYTEPQSGASTNLMENIWWCVKRNLPATHTKHTNFSMHLAEYMYRVLYPTEELFGKFVEDWVGTICILCLYHCFLFLFTPLFTLLHFLKWLLYFECLSSKSFVWLNFYIVFDHLVCHK